jgi:hypothetical protein
MFTRTLRHTKTSGSSLHTPNATLQFFFIVPSCVPPTRFYTYNETHSNILANAYKHTEKRYHRTMYNMYRNRPSLSKTHTTKLSVIKSLCQLTFVRDHYNTTTSGSVIIFTVGKQIIYQLLSILIFLFLVPFLYFSTSKTTRHESLFFLTHTL